MRYNVINEKTGIILRFAGKCAAARAARLAAEAGEVVFMTGPRGFVQRRYAPEYVSGAARCRFYREQCHKCGLWRYPDPRAEFCKKCHDYVEVWEKVKNGYQSQRVSPQARERRKQRVAEQRTQKALSPV